MDQKTMEARGLWNKTGVTEDKIIQLLQILDCSTIQEMKDRVMAELLIEKVFGSRNDQYFLVCENCGDCRKKD